METARRLRKCLETARKLLTRVDRIQQSEKAVGLAILENIAARDELRNQVAALLEEVDELLETRCGDCPRLLPVIERPRIERVH